MTDVIHIALIPIKYIGKRATNTDGTYGTNITWLAGETQSVPSDAASKMLKHTDVYARGESKASEVMAVKPKVETDDDKTQETRYAIASWDKAALASYAKNNFNVTLDKRAAVDDLRTQVTQMVDQFGVE